MFVHGRTWTDEELRAAVASGLCVSDVLRALGIRVAGGNAATVKRHIARLGLSTEHFDPRTRRGRGLRHAARPLDEVLVAGSTYSRKKLKERLYATGLKKRSCELCGQGEDWRGRRMSLILDHINGVHDDNRLENLRIACPNCAATFDTHCGRNSHAWRVERRCDRCRGAFMPETRRQRFCSRDCGSRGASGERSAPRPKARRVDRPPLDELRRRVEREGYAAVARDHGVSDNAIRKWFRAAGEQPPRKHVRRDEAA